VTKTITCHKGVGNSYQSPPLRQKKRKKFACPADVQKHLLQNPGNGEGGKRGKRRGEKKGRIPPARRKRRAIFLQTAKNDKARSGRQKKKEEKKGATMHRMKREGRASSGMQKRKGGGKKKKRKKKKQKGNPQMSCISSLSSVPLWRSGILRSLCHRQGKKREGLRAPAIRRAWLNTGCPDL